MLSLNVSVCDEIFHVAFQFLCGLNKVSHKGTGTPRSVCEISVEYMVKLSGVTY